MGIIQSSLRVRIPRRGKHKVLIKKYAQRARTTRTRRHPHTQFMCWTAATAAAGETERALELISKRIYMPVRMVIARFGKIKQVQHKHVHNMFFNICFFVCFRIKLLTVQRNLRIDVLPVIYATYV